MMIVTCQILHWAASDFGTDIGRCEFYGPIQNEEESIKVTQKSWQGLDPTTPTNTHTHIHTLSIFPTR